MHWILLNLAYNASIMAEIPASGFYLDQFEGFEIKNPDGSYTISGETIGEYMEGERSRRIAPHMSMMETVTARVLQTAFGIKLS